MSDSFVASMDSIDERYADKLGVPDSIEPSGYSQDWRNYLKSWTPAWSRRPDRGDSSAEEVKRAQKEALKDNPSYQLERAELLKSDMQTQINTLQSASVELASASIFADQSQRIANEMRRALTLNFRPWTDELVGTLFALREQAIQLIAATQNLQSAIAEYAEAQQEAGNFVFPTAADPNASSDSEEDDA